MSNLSELLPTGGGQNAVDFVASGTLSSGQTVILNSNGTVTAVAGSPESIGSAQTASTNDTHYNCAVYNPNTDKIIIAYKDDSNSSYGTAVVGSISGSTITFGTPVVFASDTVNYTAIETEPSSNHVVIAYQFSGAPYYASYGYAIVGAVSGTSISFGSAAFFEPYVTEWVAIGYDSTNNKYIIAYRGNGSSNGYGSAVVGTRSGTSISFGTVVYFQSSQCRFFAVSHDVASGKNLICFEDQTNGSDGKGIVGTISGTSISFGSSVTFESASGFPTAVRYSPDAQKNLLVYLKIDGSYSVASKIATVSGTSVSFSSETILDSGGTVFSSGLDYNTNTDQFTCAFKPAATSLVAVNIDISSGSIVVSDAVTLVSILPNYISVTYNSSDLNMAIGFNNDNNGDTAQALIYSQATTNNTSFIGITAEAISDTATGAVNVYGGINEAQTGLTIGSDYYVQNDGSISTTASAVKIGQAISATTINMMDLT